MPSLRPYQKQIASQAAQKIKEQGLVYLALAVRTGKTLTALETAKLLNAKKVLFLTKLKAIQSIKADYSNFNYKFDMTVVNDESMHKIEDIGFDLIIHDEHHRMGAFPKPSKRTRTFKKMFSNVPMIFLSGTPTPESYSQIYHQFWVSRFTPFKEHNTFYKWAKHYVNVKQKRLGYATVNDYTEARQDLIKQKIDSYMISFTQDEADFNNEIKEHILYVDMKPNTYKMAERLKKDLVIEGKDEVILADTGVKLMGKLHQMYSGTIKFESGNSMVLDDSKAKFIANHFKGKKLAVFYKFKEELNAIKMHLDITQDLNEFNTTDKSIALQIVSGREGISLKEADCIVMYNIDFSAVSYWQARDRLTFKGREQNEVYWIFAKGGIEQSVYKAVMNKKNFTLSVFKRNDDDRAWVDDKGKVYIKAPKGYATYKSKKHYNERLEMPDYVAQMPNGLKEVMLATNKIV